MYVQYVYTYRYGVQELYSKHKISDCSYPMLVVKWESKGSC